MKDGEYSLNLAGRQYDFKVEMDNLFVEIGEEWSRCYRINLPCNHSIDSDAILKTIALKYHLGENPR